MPNSAIILDTIVKATLLLALAWGAALLLKQCSAATRHLVRVFALAALLALPFSVRLLPAWHVKGIPDFIGSTASTHVSPPASAAPARSAVSSLPAPLAPALSFSTRRRRAKAEASRTSTPPRPAGRSSATQQPTIESSASVASSALISRPPASTASSASMPRTPRLAYLPALLTLVWAAGALFFLGRWQIG